MNDDFLKKLKSIVSGSSKSNQVSETAPNKIKDTEEELVNCNENLGCDCLVEFTMDSTNSWGTFGGDRAESLSYNYVRCPDTFTDEADFDNCYNLPVIPFNSGYNLKDNLK